MATHVGGVHTYETSVSRFARLGGRVNVCTQPLVPRGGTHPTIPFNMIIETCITCLLAQVQVNSDAINKYKSAVRMYACVVLCAQCAGGSGGRVAVSIRGHEL